MQQTFIPNPQHYARDEFRKLISSIQLGAWRPKFPTLHNTGVPSLAQWKAYGPTTKEGWGGSLNHYFASASKDKQPWHAGPHFVCCPDYIWYLSDLRFDGVSVRCWNPVTVGIEMVGNYEVGSDDFATGDGAKVGDNAAFVLAVLCEKYGWKLENYVHGVSGLHFHKECAIDHHACPGSKVSKAKMIASANAQLATFAANPPGPTATPAAATTAAATPATAAPAAATRRCDTPCDARHAAPPLRHPPRRRPPRGAPRSARKRTPGYYERRGYSKRPQSTWRQPATQRHGGLRSSNQGGCDRVPAIAQLRRRWMGWIANDLRYPGFIGAGSRAGHCDRRGHSERPQSAWRQSATGRHG